MFKPMDRVRTNERYFQRTGRIVEGTVIKLYCDLPPIYVGVKWEKQEGNIDDRMNGLKVLMHRDDLELVESE